MEYPLRRACRRTMSHKAAIQSTLQFSLGCGCGSAVGPASHIVSNTPPVPDVWRLLADGGAWPNEQALSRRRGRSKGGRGFPGTVRARLSRDRIQRAGATDKIGAAAPFEDLMPACNNRHYIRGTRLHRIGMLDEAAEFYARALRDEPENIRVYVRRGAALVDGGRFDEAAECCAKALSLDPRCVPVLMNMGLALRRAGRPAEAAEYYGRAIDGYGAGSGAGPDTDMARLYSNMGCALLDAGRIDEALNCCEKAIDADPDFGIGYVNKGAVLHELGRLDEAARYIHAGRTLDPSHARPS